MYRTHTNQATGVSWEIIVACPSIDSDEGGDCFLVETPRLTLNRHAAQPGRAKLYCHWRFWMPFLLLGARCYEEGIEKSKDKWNDFDACSLQR